MDFQGFQNTYPTVLILIAIVAIIGISWWSYQNIRNLSPVPKYGLAALRATALIILLLLLMNPFFYSSEEVEVKPKIAVFLDNSESVGISKGNYNGFESYKSLLNSLNFKNVEEADLEFYSIGEESSSFHPDSLNLSAPQTNLSGAVNTILEFDDEFKAAILISDGIITYGKNPVFSATSSSIPLHTIALGDTSKVKDVAVSNILTSATGYTNTRQTVEAEISQSGFKGSSISVSVLSGEEVIQEKELHFEADDQVLNLEFELELEEAGLKQYEIKVNPLEDEWSEENNSSIFSIDVLDSKVKILHIAFEIHPDVKTVRSIINEDINNELTTLTWLGGNRFVEDLPEEDEFNLIAIHGSPQESRDFNFLNHLSNTPVIYFSTSTSVNNDNNFKEDIRLIEARSAQTAKVTLSPLLNSDEHPILELPVISFQAAPKLTSPLQSDLSNLQYVALFSSVFNNLDTESPIIAVVEQGNLRRAHVYAWDWFRMKQSLNEQHRQFVSQLISNLITWTSSNPDDENLQVSPSKQTFSTFENPSITASLKNESGENEEGAIIEIEVFSDETSRSFNMENSGNGNYTLDLPRFAEGLYEFEATARKGNREIDSKRGEFLISNASSELTNTTRNDELLKSLSNNSNGTFFTYNEIDGFWDSLRTAGVFESQSQTIERYAYPVRSLTWFMVVLLLLGTEWIARKYYSLP